MDRAHYDNFRRLLEAEKPDVLFTQWPIDNHRDHRATSMLSYDAWLAIGKSFGLYYYEVSDGEDTRMFAPTDYVDITRFRGIESGHREAEAFVRHVASVGSPLPR